ncbi:hypothetical protein HOP50_04g28290 [Chloropicon primus]|uniref:Uncharacterized protein n=1 Tax=Chloropicon primus TaxID=1764295 RepID=A0A5B8MJ59_9CHLO|nr:hypothetical protein A3770_04p28290 [Chloropicon primus]UPQ99521.1 hypothetical protein HOP50_04g28290 [Chloropicon primus]|eukprot:QDZ20311.1 hypothetical protein A3770_04p28290 [Chloropicon primus]
MAEVEDAPQGSSRDLEEAQESEAKAREVWLQVQRESRKDGTERSLEQLDKLVIEASRGLEHLASISHRIEAHTAKATRQSWKHSLRYTIQASIWIQCELGRVGLRSGSESFAELFDACFARNAESMDREVLDTTNFETILEHVDTCGLPVDLFVPLVEDAEQHLDRGLQDKLLGTLATNLKLVLILVPIVRLRDDGEGNPAPALGSKHDIRSLFLYALQFCVNDSWHWKPSWTNPELSEMAASIIEKLVCSRQTGEANSLAPMDVLAAALIRTYPRLHLLVVDRYTSIMRRLESQATMYAEVEDNESAFQMTTLLHILYWLMQGMTYRSFVDNDYSLSEDLFPVILHACNSSTQTMQYYGLHCLTLLIRSAPATVIKWHKDALYGCLGKYMQHSDTTIWSVGISAALEASIAIEGKNKDSDRLLDLMESLVEQGEVMAGPKRFTLWLHLMARLVPCLGARSCCFLGRIIAILDRWLVLSGSGADCTGGKDFLLDLIEACWPGVHMHRAEIEGIVDRLAERLSQADVLAMRRKFREGVDASREALQGLVGSNNNAV